MTKFRVIFLILVLLNAVGE